MALALMSTNKAELVEVNGYGAKSANDESANIFTLFTFYMYDKCFKNKYN